MNLILGGTHGLGKQIAENLQQRGEEVFAVGRSYRPDTDGSGMAADISKEADVQEVINWIDGLGQTALKGFYWVAGIGYQGDFSDQPDPKTMADVNFSAVMPIAQAAWQKQLESVDPSNYVVVSSTSGFRSRKNEAVYAATKHAQVGFTRSLGMESERLDSLVKVALFMPGGMQTPFWNEQKPDVYDNFMDARDVAAFICDKTLAQSEAYLEEKIERDDL